MEAAPGFEPGNKGFADPRLTTWLCRLEEVAGRRVIAHPRLGLQSQRVSWTLALHVPAVRNRKLATPMATVLTVRRLASTHTRRTMPDRQLAMTGAQPQLCRWGVGNRVFDLIPWASSRGAAESLAPATVAGTEAPSPNGTRRATASARHGRGATEGGGSNYTGSLCSTQSVPNLPVPTQSSTWGEIRLIYR